MHRTTKRKLLNGLVSAALLTAGCADSPVVDVPDSHPAAELVAGGVVDIEAFTEGALALNLPSLCGAGGGVRPWQLCLAHSNDITAFVPLGNTEGMVARVTGTGLGRGVLIRLDTGRMFGIPRDGGAISVSIETGDRQIGTLGAGAFPPDS